MAKIDTKHPKYTKFAPDWKIVSDVYEGERRVKAEGMEYLPVTQSMIRAGMHAGGDGYKAYLSYKTRAVFHDFLAEAVEAMVGVMHSREAVIELPAAMESMLESASVTGESLQMLLRRINVQQLVKGRLGLLADLPSTVRTGLVLPYIAVYEAESIINWDNGKREDPVGQNLNMVVLDESEEERTSAFDWDMVKKHRVLILGDTQENEGKGERAIYRYAVVREEEAFTDEMLQEATVRGTALEQIPFVFINSKDVVPEPDDPPLLGLANLSLAIYRGEADYRQSLFMQGQDTLVTMGLTGEDDQIEVGSGAHIKLPADGDAKFIGVESKGIDEQRKAIENDMRRASFKAAQALDNNTQQAQSGDALRIRVSARTATLNQVALTGAFGLETILKQIATWIGANPEEVVVEPNLDFVDTEADGRTMVELVSAKNMGFPLSRETLHKIAQERGLTEMEFEDEIALIEGEEPLGTTILENTEEDDDADGGQGDQATRQQGTGTDPNADDEGGEG